MKNFITAEEARRITDENDATIDLILKDIDKNIRLVAKIADRLACYTTQCWTAKSVMEFDVKPNQLQETVMKKLSEFGYAVRFDTDGETYVPKALSDDNGKGPEYINWCIIIRW